MKAIKFVTCLSSVSLLVVLAGGWVSRDGEVPHGQLSDALVTRHIEFAPKQANPLKVLVTAYGPGQRELIELKERFGYTPVLYPVKSREDYSPWEESRRKGKLTPSVYFPSFDEPEFLARSGKLLDELPSCDAIVIGRTFPQVFPSEVMDRFLARVREGAGFLFLAPSVEKVDLPGVELKAIDPKDIFPVDLVPRLAGVACYEGRFGKGRVLEVVYPESSLEIPPEVLRRDLRGGLECLTPDDSNDPLYYDFCLAFVGKCLWRVCGKEVKSKVEGERRIVNLFNADGEESEAGSRSAVLKLTRRVDAQGRTIDYDISSAVPKADVARLKVSFERDAWKTGEEICGKLTVPERGDVRLSLTDEFGREIGRRDFAGVQGSVPLTFRLPPFGSKYARVKVALRANGRLVDEAFDKLYFNTVEEDREDFNFTIWSGHNSQSRVSQIALGQLKAAGVDNVMNYIAGNYSYGRKHLAPRAIHEAGLNVSPYVAWIRGAEGKERFGKDCGEFGKLERFRRTGKFPTGNPRIVHNDTAIQDVAEATAPLGALFYNIGDENHLAEKLEKENCFCDKCQERFREFLRKKYGTLEKLNGTYHVRYAAWNEVKALPFVEAAKKRRMSLWYDFRTFMEDQFTDAHLFLSEQIKSKDPSALVGCEGCTYPASSFPGWRFYSLFPQFGYCALYYTDRDAQALQYLPKGAMTGAWFGCYEGENTEPFTRRPPWQHLFAGMNGTSWWYAAMEQRGMSFSNCNVFRPDLTVLPNLLTAGEEVRFIRESGLGKMLIHSKRVVDGVAVHYSNISLHGSTIEPGVTSWELSHNEFAAALNEASVGYEYLSPPEIEKDGIPSRVKVLLLPDSQAVTDAECAAMRGFVERGGVLIADVIPGMMDGNCAYRETSPLADLFGKEKCVPKKTGRGYGIWIDDYLRGADARVGAHSAGGVAAGLLRMLALGGVKTPAAVTDEAGSLTRAAWFRTADGALVAGLLGPRSSASKVKAVGAEAAMKGVGAVGGSAVRRFTFDHDVTAYDFAAGGRKIGRGRTFEITLDPDIGRAIAFTEKDPVAPKLTVSGKSVAPGEAVTLAASPVVGCAVFEVRDPSGRIVRRMRALDGKSVFSPAWNEPKGRYVMSVRSAIGGLSAEQKVEVR